MLAHASQCSHGGKQTTTRHVAFRCVGHGIAILLVRRAGHLAAVEGGLAIGVAIHGTWELWNSKWGAIGVPGSSGSVIWVHLGQGNSARSFLRKAASATLRDSFRGEMELVPVKGRRSKDGTCGLDPRVSDQQHGSPEPQAVPPV